MASTVSELLVKVKPEGVKQTRDELEGSTEAFGDMADETAASVGVLEKFSKRWMGAGLVFGATLGTLTAAIASKMPIIDEVASGMDMVLTSLAYKIDESVRPSLSNLTDDFADLASEIDDTSGAAEGIGTALAGSINIALEHLNEKDFEATTTIDFVFEVGKVTVKGIDKEELAKFITSDLGQIALSGIRMGPIGIVNEVGQQIGEDLAEDAADWLEENTPQKIKDAIRNINWFGLGRDLVTMGPIGAFTWLGEQAGNAIADVIGDALEDRLPIARAKFDMWVNDFEAGIDEAVTRFRFSFNTGWEIVLNDFRGFLNDFIADFEDKINSVINFSNRFLNTNFGNVSISRLQTTSPSAIVGRNRRAMNRELSEIDSRRRSENRQIERMIAEMQNTTHQTTVNVDGKEVANATTPYVGQGAVNVGATAVRR